MESSQQATPEARIPVQVDFQGVFEALMQNVVAEHARQTEYFQSEILRLKRLLGSREGAAELSAEEAQQGDAPGGNEVDASSFEQDDDAESGTPSLHRDQSRSSQMLRKSDSNLTTSQFGLSTKNSIPSERRLSDRVAGVVSTSMSLVNAPSSVTDRLVHFIKWVGSIQEPTRSGRLHWLVHSPPFHLLVGAVIILNTWFIIRTADLDMEASLSAEQNVEGVEENKQLAIEVVFTCLYAIEWALRLRVHRLYFFVNKDRWWNLMDTVLLLLACNELRTIAVYSSQDLSLTYVRLLRLLKIVRGLRLMREFRFVREMRLILDCVFQSAGQLFLCTVLVLYVLCMFSVIFVQVLADFLVDSGATSDSLTHTRIRESFGSVVKAMVSLYMATTGGSDWERQYAVFYEAGTGATLLYLFFISFFVVVVWNIVMSTFVEKALQLALPDIDTMMADKHFRDARDAKEICKMISEIVDENSDGLIHVAEFAAHVNNPNFQDFLQIRGFDVKSAASFFDMLKSMSDQEDAVDVETFVACCLRLQGVATSIDLQTLRFEMKRMYYKQKSKMATLENLVSELVDKVVKAPTGAPSSARPSNELQQRKPRQAAEVNCSVTPKLVSKDVATHDIECAPIVPSLPGVMNEGARTDDVFQRDTSFSTYRETL